MRLFTLLTKSSIFLTEKLAPDPEKYEINFAFKRGHIQGSPDTTGLGLLCAGVSAIYEITAARRCCPARVRGGAPRWGHLPGPVRQRAGESG